ncbi:glycosyltransferase family 4 protein [Alicyclobacillus sp. SO9]|uniref:glycosyltransferase family 4 protein n=1 Tax=Alicyclobacillus sp. SO9 TaxID=2665646 RepID=UPI0018E885D8|nr:glycosyltransferase family 4 protein [Alicyclobacillus sp. SO9]QQE78736.1 glycosyltransferase family 4 protein [Alicyclobacillus sp. SO9]
MKVRVFTHPIMYLGGGEIQFLETADALRRKGVDVITTPAYKGPPPDIVHLFGPHGSLYKGIVDYCIDAGIPYVVSTIYASTGTSPLRRTHRKLMVSLMRNGRTSRLLQGRYKWLPELMRGANLLLPNTIAEQELVLDTFRFLDADKFEIIPNAVERKFLHSKGNLFNERYLPEGDFVLNVARLEPRKNQLTLIRAAKKFGFKLIIIGDLSVDPAYVKMCRDEAVNADVSFLGPVTHDDPLLASAYAASHVFCLPSREETPGIAALEAFLAGANIVITKYGGAEQYLGSNASYIDPYDVDDLGKAILSKLNSKRPAQSDREALANKYDWDAVAEKTLHVYKTLLGER